MNNMYVWFFDLNYVYLIHTYFYTGLKILKILDILLKYVLHIRYSIILCIYFILHWIMLRNLSSIKNKKNNEMRSSNFLYNFCSKINRAHFGLCKFRMEICALFNKSVNKAFDKIGGHPRSGPRTIHDYKLQWAELLVLSINSKYVFLWSYLISPCTYE